MMRSENRRAFSVNCELKGKYQPKIKPTQIHPVRKSITRNLAKRYDLANMWCDPFVLFVKESWWNEIRRFHPIELPRHSRNLGHR